MTASAGLAGVFELGARGGRVPPNREAEFQFWNRVSRRFPAFHPK